MTLANKAEARHEIKHCLAVGKDVPVICGFNSKTVVFFLHQFKSLDGLLSKVQKACGFNGIIADTFGKVKRGYKITRSDRYFGRLRNYYFRE